MLTIQTPAGSFSLEADGENIEFKVVNVKQLFNDQNSTQQKVDYAVVLLPQLPLQFHYDYLALKSNDALAGAQFDDMATDQFYEGRVWHKGTQAFATGVYVDDAELGQHTIADESLLAGYYEIDTQFRFDLLFQISYQRKSTETDLALDLSLECLSKVRWHYQQALGCLVGGAVGDALGYPVEFDQLQTIQTTYGLNGITFANFKGQPLISDDTQMTLFTATGLCLPGERLANVWASYQDWLDTQFKRDQTELSHQPVSWLVTIPSLFASREPGRTCLMALSHGIPGTLERPLNQSKGCGGVMRVAPVALSHFSQAEVVETAAQVAALTHGHPLSTIASAYFALLIRRLMIFNQPLSGELVATMGIIEQRFSDWPTLELFKQRLILAQTLAINSMSDQANLAKLGLGWTAEETVAIAVYCTLRYSGHNQVSRAIEVAINHDGDSDSTGALTGQIVGTIYGYDGLPSDFSERLELQLVFEKTARELMSASSGRAE